MKLSLVGLGFVSLLLLLISLYVNSRADQPITFNHKEQHEEGIVCITCHAHFKD